MSAFAKGLQSGTLVAQGWVDAYETARKRREKEELREGLKRASALDQQTNFTKRQATPEEFARAQAETQALGQADAATFGFNSDFDPQGGMEMYAPAAPSRTAQVTAPDGYSLGGLTRATPFTQDEIQRARTEEMAKIYEQQAMPEEAMRMRSLAQQQELTGLQLGQTRRQEKLEIANQIATEQVSKLFSSGKQIDVPALFEIAKNTGADPNLLVRLAADNLNLTEKIVENSTKNLIKDIRKAATSPDEFNKLLAEKFDTDLTDNISPQLREVNGGYRVFYGDKPLSPLFKDDKNISALSQLSQFYQGQIEGKPLEIAVQLATLEQTRATTRKSEEQTLLAKDQRLGLPAAATGANLDRQIKLAEQLRKQVDDIQKQLENTTPNSKRFENLSKQLDDKNADLYRVTQSVQSGLYSGPSAKVGNTINVRGTTYKKIKSGLDSDQTTWEPVEGGAAAPARGLTPGAAPASSTAPREQAPVPAGIGRMGQSYGRLTPEAIVVEGVRRGDPRAIQEQQRRREIEEAYRTQTPGYNPADVF